MTKLIRFIWQFFPQLQEARDWVGGKAWYRSKTIWTNLIILTSSAAAYWLGPAYGVSDAEAVALATGISSAVNIVLRIVTWQPIDA